MESRSFYNEILTEHNIHPEFKHDLPDADLVLEGVNPNCGDDIFLKLKLDGDEIVDGAFVGDGCAISQASADIMLGMIVGKKKEEVRIVMNGAGAAAISICRLLLKAGFKDVTLCDRKGAIYEGRTEGMNPVKEEMSKLTNLQKKQGSLAEMLVGADVFIGVSAPGAVTTEMVKTMNKDAIIFACANPTPEIFPDDAKAGGAKVISTGRSDFPNQINNVLAFPGIFRGAFDVRASDINDEMKIAASKALADLITDEELSPEYIIPKAFDKRVGPAVAKAVAEAAKATGVARI